MAEATKRRATTIVLLNIQSSGPRLVLAAPSILPPPKAEPKEPSEY